MTPPSSEIINRDYRPRLNEIEWSTTDYANRYSELIAIIGSSQKCAILAGAGVSANLYPTWPDIVSKLSEKLAIPVNDIKEMTGEEFLEFFETCFNSDEDLFYNSLEEIFNPKVKPYDAIHRYILETPFCDILTTNIDPCLINYSKEKKRAGGSYNKRLFFYPNSLPVTTLKNGNLYHIHGVHFDEDGNKHIKETIFTNSQYKLAYEHDSILRIFLLSILREINILFVGFSLQDPAIKELIRISDEPSKGSTSTVALVSRFVILPEEYIVDGENYQRDSSSEQKQEEFCNDHNIKVIRYSAKKDHKSVENIMENILILTRVKNVL